MTEQMKQTFDFKQIGKRMPYRVPNGFFQEMEYNVLDAVINKRPKICPRCAFIELLQRYCLGPHF